jgi:hypothetical protein
MIRESGDLVVQSPLRFLGCITRVKGLDWVRRRPVPKGTLDAEELAVSLSDTRYEPVFPAAAKPGPTQDYLLFQL